MAVPAQVVSLYHWKKKQARKELSVISDLEREYMTKSSRKVYIALEELNFFWDEREIEDFRKMWSAGFSILDIARMFDRDPDEVLILAIDQGKQELIEPRKGGVFGRRMR
ncbi:hypothetical protein [Risungbinella massiliensis]|uniref:hypothetical protein n=1 Tax=Risungbinella massiliensis TaxID=1329796 RepID=UPI00069BEB3D|nr:hypothetical protein [Risungbinella massiliensis]